MTDLLAERFAALVEPGQADWADVLQRARPRRRGCRGNEDAKQ